LWRWVGPLAALLILTLVGFILHHQLARLHIKGVLAHLHAIPQRQILTALLFTALSYWLLTTYEVLALRYLRRAIPTRGSCLPPSSPIPSGIRWASPSSPARPSASACTSRRG